MKQRIVYLSYSANEITGGIKMAFRHVEALIENGFDAIVATPDGQAPTWFASTAPVVELVAVEPADDILVFPENNHDLLQHCASWPNRKIVFCQGIYMAQRGLGGKKSYADFGVEAIIACGWSTAMFCRRRFPELPTHLVPNFIDTKLFTLSASKGLQIAYMPRKRLLEAEFIQDLFRAEHPEFANVPWVKLVGQPEPSVISAMQQSAVFLSLARFESSPLTMLEAMACGCVSAGFTGFGGRDFTNDRNGFWAQDEDCFECVRQLVRACRLASGGGPLYQHMVEQALATARSFSRASSVKALVEFWQR